MADSSQVNRTDLMLCCDHFITDQQGKVSLIGIFEQINARALPLLIARFFFVAHIKNAVGNRLSLALLRPNKDQIGFPSIDFKETFNQKEITIDLSTLRAVWEVDNMSFAEEGQHALILSMDDKEINRYPLKVTLIKDDNYAAGL